MADAVIHKFATPGGVEARPLFELVLCFRHLGKPTDDVIAEVTMNINHATCNECWDLWKQGIYE